jgi:hypothetical protein
MEELGKITDIANRLAKGINDDDDPALILVSLLFLAAATLNTVNHVKSLDYSVERAKDTLEGFVRLQQNAMNSDIETQEILRRIMK